MISDSRIWRGWGQCWIITYSRHCRTYGDESSWWSAYRVWSLLQKVWGSYHMRTGFVNWISVPLSVAGFAVTSAWPITYSTIAFTCRRRSFKRLQRNETSADMTSIVATVVFVCSGEQYFTWWCYPSGSIISRPNLSKFSRLIMSSVFGTQQSRFYSSWFCMF